MRRTLLIAIVLLATAWCLAARGARADEPVQVPPAEASPVQVPPNTLTIENQSGDPVRVEVVGPSAQVIEMADSDTRTVNVAAGEYVMHVRYGNDPKAYTYSKVAPFKVEQTATTYMAATVTIDCTALRSPEPIP